MVTLKEEEAFAFALKEEFLDSCCSFCFMDNVPVRKCAACYMVSYCSKNCQKNDWIDHKNECRLLQSWNKSHSFLPTAHVRIASRILLMSEERRSKAAFNGRTWDSIVFNIEDLWKNPDEANFYKKVRLFKEFLEPIKNVSLEELENTLGKTQKIAFTATNKSTNVKAIGACVFLGFSVHPHNCLPDGAFLIQGTKCLYRAYNANAVYSSELTVSFVKNVPFTVFHCSRKEKLKKMDYIECHCALCTNDSHIINRMGESCYVSCCKDGAGILDENSNEPYRCNKCGKTSTITQRQVKNVQSSIDRHIEENKDVENLIRPDGSRILSKAMTLLEVSTAVLSMFNYRVLDLHNQIINWAVVSEKALALKLQEAVIPAFEYYLPEAHPRRANHLMTMAVFKQNLGMPDAADATYKAYMSSVACYGEDHSLTKGLQQMHFRLLTGQMEHMMGFLRH